MDMLGNDEMMK
jgi:hypothetical protein